MAGNYEIYISEILEAPIRYGSTMVSFITYNSYIFQETQKSSLLIHFFLDRDIYMNF